MLPFKTSGDAIFSCRIDFQTAGVANLFFCTEDNTMVPLHLSLRKRISQIIINSDIGSGWNSEARLTADFPDSVIHLALEFNDKGVRIIMDGAIIHHLDSEGFPHLEKIVAVRYEGAVLHSGFEIGGPANKDRKGLADLKVASPCLVKGWAYDPIHPECPCEMKVEGLDELIPVQNMFDSQANWRPGEPSEWKMVEAVIPGWVWLGVNESDMVRLQMFSNGIACGNPITLSRQLMATLIGAFASTADYLKSTREVLAAIEHIRFAKLSPMLSVNANAFFAKAAAYYKVSSFLLTDLDAGDVPIPPPSLVESQSSTSDYLNRKAQALFIETMRNNPEGDAGETLAQVLLAYNLQGDCRNSFFMGLSEFFCARDEFTVLYAQMTKSGQPLLKSGDNSWHNSTVLPFLLLQGQAVEVLCLIRKFKKTQGWICNSCVAWTARQIIRGGIGNVLVGERLKEKVLLALVSFLDDQAASYWGRAHCRSFIGLAIHMLEQKACFRDPIQQEIEIFLLRNYGLSQNFWSEISDLISSGRLKLSQRLETAKSLFFRVSARVADDHVSIGEALRFFEHWNNRDAARFRIELLGPAGIEPDAGGKIDSASLIKDRIDLSEHVIRLLAFPNDRQPTPEFAEQAYESILQKHQYIANAPFYQLQHTVSRRAWELIMEVHDAAKQSADISSRLQDILHDLETLGSVRSRFLGLGIMVAIMNTLVEMDADDLAEIVLVRLAKATSLRLPRHKSKGIAKHPCLENALAAMLRAQATKPSALRGTVLHSFRNYLRNHDECPNPNACADELWTTESLFFDTIVVVMSCKPYLDTRVQEIRKGWLASLSSLGVPYVIMVGDGNDERVDDVVYLDAPDNYEGLPQKTIKMIEWVAGRTRFTHMLKIDDDCFLDAEEFFHSQSYRKFDYYGRLIVRNIGDTDRQWHHGKSTSMRGRMELDKSPEPSRFADGGSGYLLSRAAMLAALSAVHTPQGRKLVGNSFMEDKMLGDLLATKGISLHDEDYYVSVLRRTHSNAIPVSIWMNSFFPSKATSVKLIHLDSDRTQDTALRLKDGYGLFPKKIWPSFSPVQLGHNTNAIELVSEEAKLARLNKAPVAVIACIRNEMFMLPHFLEHYRKLGIECFLFADNLSDDGSLEYLAGQPDVVTFSVDTQYRLSQYGVAWQQALLSSLRVGRWSIVADADELLVFKGWEKKRLPDHLPAFDSQGVDGVRIFMIDMYPKVPLSDTLFKKGNPFQEAGYVEKSPLLFNSPAQGPYANAPTWTSALRHRLIRGSRTEQFVAQKIALLKYKPWMKLSAGLHYIADVALADEEMIFAHFKYHAEFRSKVINEVARGQHFNDAEEYRKYLTVMAEGRDMIYDPAISVPWRECEFVKALLD